jgi:uncharacterized protein (TIGR03085 family)
MTTPLDARERVQICARFDELGPDAPTLCEGWTTFDLAAHLVVRERNPLAGPGILLGDKVPALGHVTERAMEREKERGWTAVVERVRTGPPFGPFAIPVVREQINFVEYLVHHEDVRRANGMGPRTGIHDLQEAAWQQLGRLSRFLRGFPHGVGLELARPDGAVHVARRGAMSGRLTGEPIELVLYLYGRGDHAEVELGGDPAATEAVKNARLGL